VARRVESLELSASEGDTYVLGMHEDVIRPRLSSDEETGHAPRPHTILNQSSIPGAIRLDRLGEARAPSHIE